jgi:hypothetical protein
MTILRRYSTGIICLIELTANVVFTFCSPIIAQFLENVYDLTPDTVGYVISLAPLAYVLTCIPVSKIKKGKREVPKHHLKLVHLFRNGISRLKFHLHRARFRDHWDRALLSLDADLLGPSGHGLLLPVPTYT